MLRNADTKVIGRENVFLKSGSNGRPIGNELGNDIPHLAVQVKICRQKAKGKDHGNDIFVAHPAADN